MRKLIAKLRDFRDYSELWELLHELTQLLGVRSFQDLRGAVDELLFDRERLNRLKRAIERGDSDLLAVLDKR